jgi:hypothetical protein
METQRPQIVKAVLSKKSNAGGITIPDWLQTILQRHNNKNSMVLVQIQAGRPMDQNRRFRHKPTNL